MFVNDLKLLLRSAKLRLPARVARLEEGDGEHAKVDGVEAEAHDAKVAQHKLRAARRASRRLGSGRGMGERARAFST
jgi:hypothetical protein